jgi:hypothetical protein
MTSVSPCVYPIPREARVVGEMSRPTSMVSGGSATLKHGSLQKLARGTAPPVNWLPSRSRAPRQRHRTQRNAVDNKNLLTVIVTASASPLNPSTAILRELILSLRHLQLPKGNPVLLSHDGPRVSKWAQAPLNTSIEWRVMSKQLQMSEFPPKYLRYLGNIEAMLPAAIECTGLALRLLVRATNGYLAGNIAFALSFVRTPYVLKVEHDHLFTRPFDALSIVHDMIADPRLKYIRFNRRENVRVRCDNGDYYRHSPFDQDLAKQLWGLHAPPPYTALANNYTRTSCFSDMNHLTPTSYYRNLLLPYMLKSDCKDAKDCYPKVSPENLVQDHCWIARNHSVFGTYIFDGISAPPTIAHVDAALHGVGEVLPQVKEWVKTVKERARNGTDDPPFECRQPLDLRPPKGLSVANTYYRPREPKHLPAVQKHLTANPPRQPASSLTGERVRPRPASPRRAAKVGKDRGVAPTASQLVGELGEG